MYNTVFLHESYHVKEEHCEWKLCNGTNCTASSEDQGSNVYKILTIFYYFNEVDNPYTVETVPDVIWKRTPTTQQSTI
jgi:hypothetical protein